MLRALTITHLLLFLLQGAALADDDLSNVLEGIRKNYGNLSCLTIPYTREVTTRSMTMLGNQVKGDIATGRIYFKPPHFLKLEQATPEPETVITNGDTLLWYIPGKNRVYRYSAQEFGKELRLLCDIFLGLIQVEERFQVILLDSNNKGEHQIELRPTPPWQEINRVVLTVRTDHDISMVSIHYQLGSITRFELEDMIVKEKFDKNFFQFIFPEGVKVVDETKQ
jgi:outer membrane lipoprotein-sorting protein